MFMKELLPKRLGKFGLKLAEDKTRMILFGRFAKERARGERVETFDFLGFKHYCGRSKIGKFRVKRKTVKKKFSAKVREMKILIKDHRYLKVTEMIRQINIKLRRHY